MKMDILRNALCFVLISLSIFAYSLAFWGDEEVENEDVPTRNILIFGGNGFIGSETVVNLLDKGLTNITIVNRGGQYWDASDRIFGNVKSITCDRTKDLNEKCPELMEEIKEKSFEYVIDFSATKAKMLKETLAALSNKVGVYILISTDQIYDVCTSDLENLREERHAVRPQDSDEAKQLSYRYHLSEERFQVEEALLDNHNDDGVDYVILRLSDAIGPRDTTFRWWIYQVWARLSNTMTEHPIHIPAFLNNYQMSFVYSKDVAEVISQLVLNGVKDEEQVINEAFNLAWPKRFTLIDMLNEVNKNLGLDDLDITVLETQGHQNHFYSYPSTRSGALNTTKAEEILNFKPTDWHIAVKETVEFFENAMKGEVFSKQRDEIVQVVGSSLFGQDLIKYYEALETVYDIDLKHFKLTKDEL